MTVHLIPSYRPVPPRFRLELIGPARVSLDGEPLTFAYEKVLALLAYLAVEADRPHRRTALAELLWPDQVEPAARHNLSQALFHLRRLLPDDLVADLLLTTRDTVRLSLADTVWVDVLSFRRLARSPDDERRTTDDRSPPAIEVSVVGRRSPADVARLEQAVALYRSEFLEGLGVGDSPGFDEWVLLTRESLRAQACAALRRLSAPEGGAPEIGRRSAYARRWAALDPFDEAAHRQLMLALAEHGQRAAALLQYEHCRRLLAAELGVEPDPATTALYEELKQHAPAAPPAVPQRDLRLDALPPPTRLIGRESDLAAVSALLADASSRLITITGPGGVGKTSLALAAADAAAFTHGICLVQLAAVHEPAQVPAAIAQALDLRLKDGAAPEDLVYAALAPRHALLLLDNCEHLLPGLVGLIGGLLAAAPRLSILATSRVALQLSHERRHQLAPLALPDDSEPPEAQRRAAAVALFIERALAVRPGLELDPVLVGAICRRLDGLPLAIELAAPRIRLIRLPELLARLERRLPLLSGGPRDLPERQQNLAATIDWSYQLLNPAQQALFRRLAVFVGGWTTAAAELGCADLAGDPAEVLDGLATLLDANLIVEMANPDGEPRCTMLETIREFALEQLAAGGELSRAQALHAQAMVSLAEQAERELAGPAQRVWLQRIDQERGNIRAALEWCLGHAVGAGLQIAGDLGRYWVLRGHRREGHDWLERLLAQAVPGDQPAPTDAERASGLLMSGMLAMFLGDLTLAEARLQDSLARFAQLGDERNIAWALNNLGNVALQRSDYAEAEGYYQRSLALRRAHGHTEGIASALNNLAEVARSQGDLQTARAYFEQSLIAYRQLGNDAYAASVMGHIGTILLQQGDYDGAEQMYVAGLTIAEGLGVKPVVRQVLNGLGDLACARRRYAEAKGHYRRCMAVAAEIQQTGAVALALQSLAAVAWAEEQAERAIALIAAATRYRGEVVEEPEVVAGYQRTLAALRGAVDGLTFAECWAYGAALSLERAIAYAALA